MARMAQVKSPCRSPAGQSRQNRQRVRVAGAVLLLRLAVLAVLAALAALAALAVDALPDKKPKTKPILSLQRSTLIPRIYNVEHCTDKEHSLRMINMTNSMGRFGGDVYNLDFQLLRPAKKISQMKMMLQRCTGTISPTMCEKYNTWTWSTGLCDMMVAKHMAWSPFIELIRPPLRCPLQAGMYSMPNATWDLDAIDRLAPGNNIEKYIWLGEINTFDEKSALLTCIKWATEARRVRIKGDGIFG